MYYSPLQDISTIFLAGTYIQFPESDYVKRKAKDIPVPKTSTHQVVKAMIHLVLLSSYIVEITSREYTSKIGAQLIRGGLYPRSELPSFTVESLIQTLQSS